MVNWKNFYGKIKKIMNNLMMIQVVVMFWDKMIIFYFKMG